MEENWKALEFIVLNHRDAKDVFILGGMEEITLVVDDSNININTILSSRHVGPIKSRVDEWARILDLFSKTLVRIRVSALGVGETSTRILRRLAFFKKKIMQQSIAIYRGVVRWKKMRMNECVGLNI